MIVKSERRALAELEVGEVGEFYALLADRQRKSTRDGKPYFMLRFRDRRRQVAVPLWDNSPFFAECELSWKVGQHFRIRGLYQEHERFGPQVEIHSIRLATPEDRHDGYDPNGFEVCSRFDVDQMYDRLLEYAASISDRPMRELVLYLLIDNAVAIKRHPAASRNHHAYRGGYLEHTVSVVETGIYLADKYRRYYQELRPPLNRDLIIAGCILHDIGKVQELDYKAESTSYTVSGQLLGHILLGLQMVRDAARHVEHLDPELLLYLEHIITAHQATPEWGSPKEPMLPEALLVHYADDIDAKMNMFAHILAADESEGPMTDRNNALRRPLLRVRKV